MKLDYVPPQHTDALYGMMMRPLMLNRGLLDRGEIVTDARNRATHDVAESQLVYRRAVVQSLPAAFLVN